MKKKILLLLLSILFTGVTAYAAGDLIVNGNLGIGTTNPLGKFHVNAADTSTAVRLDLISNSAPFATTIGAFYSVIAQQTGINWLAYVGFQGQVGLTGSGNVGSLVGAENIVYLSSTTSSTVASGKGNTAILRRGSQNTANHTLTNYYGFHSFAQANVGSGNISGTDWRHAYFENFPSFGGALTNATGLWIDKQTRGTNNYGIVLDGDGAVGDYGSAVVLGTSQNAYLYGKADGVYVYDGTNETKISPHDPDTGEWIYYSKNIKTGKVVRVDMERLVKAVENITGETFMIETPEEEK